MFIEYYQPPIVNVRLILGLFLFVLVWILSLFILEKELSIFPMVL